MCEAEGHDAVGGRRLKFRTVFCFYLFCLKSTALVGKMCGVTGHTIWASEVYVVE